jgi:hypothetical protein
MPRTRSDRQDLVLRDAAGRPTTNPADAASGEVIELRKHGGVRRRGFFLTREELPWLPVGESAFLLWVFAALLLTWVVIGIALLLFV